MMGLDIMYTIKEAHEKLNCNRQTVNNWIKRLDIEVATIDGMYRLTEEQYNMIADKVNANRTNQHANDNTNDAKTHNDNTNDNTNNVNAIDILQSHIEEQRNTIRDLSRMLDQQQQLSINDKRKIDKLENEVQQYRLSHTDTNNSAHDNNGYINKRKDVSNENATTNTGHSNNNEDNNSAHTATHETTQISNSAASHTQSDIHTDDISDDNKNEDVTTVDNKEGANTLSNEHTDDNKNATNTGTYKDNKGAEHKNKIGFFAKIFGK